ncbi:hypothetical protein QR98_0089360 [Sarcoptes scabiei]|uniref:Uncharacterized protein n=1 Tax=Sarcoptes scabiei TaxID=52283 RepID=A0A132AHA3_SARSC|nr:hypothetical protein QR98_0089360 [Sarcoptes scabiei]
MNISANWIEIEQVFIKEISKSEKKQSRFDWKYLVENVGGSNRIRTIEYRMDNFQMIRTY